MMRRLIIVNTYFQLIVAIQLKCTIFQRDKIVVLISDRSKNAEKIAKTLEKMNLFEEVHFIETNTVIVNRSRFDRITDFVKISFSRKNRFSKYLQEIENCCFDELICYNYSIDTYGVFSDLYESNPNVKVSLYEEGILSYSVRAGTNYRRKMIRLLRHMGSKKDITDSFGCFYCFFPNLYQANMFKPIKIPEIDAQSQCASILRSVFGIDQKELIYPQKYLFFSSVYDFEGGDPIGEYQLACRIADAVGKENLLIKTHPRDTRTIYEDNGFLVDRNSSIPWEAIQLSGDFSGKVFLSVNSGSVLAGNTMAKNPVRIYYMYKLCDISGNPACQKSAYDIETLIHQESMKNILKTIKIAESIEEIL